MGQVTVFRIHDGGTEQIRCKDLFLDVRVLVSDIYALAVVIDLAARSDLMNGIRQETQPEQFKEVREAFPFDREFDGVVRAYVDAG